MTSGLRDRNYLVPRRQAQARPHRVLSTGAASNNDKLTDVMLQRRLDSKPVSLMNSSRSIRCALGNLRGRKGHVSCLLALEGHALAWRFAAYILRGLLLCSIVFRVEAQYAQQATLTLGGGQGGVAISSDGNTAIIGGELDNNFVGAAWIFVRSGGVWSQQAKLVANDAVATPQQGYDVSLSSDGNTAIVGGVNDNNGIGAAWVFTRSEGRWSQQGSKLIGGGAVGAAAQGSSVRLSSDGNTALIGGFRDNGGIGAAWVFTRSEGIWRQRGNKLGASDAAGSANLGLSAALSSDGSTAIIGGSGDNNFVGAAWVFVQSGGTWTQQGGKLVGSGASSGALVGDSVALSSDGKTAIIGGDHNDGGGSAWVFTRTGSGWTQQGGALVGTGAVGNPSQGRSVALSSDGNTAIVGGLSDSNGVGATWVFTRSGGVWNQQGSKLVGGGAGGAIAQGASVALSSDGSTLLIDGGASAAWVFTRSFSFGSPLTYPTGNMPAATASADFNGDGKLDLAVANAGSSSVSIFLGNGDGTFASATTIAIPGGCAADKLTPGDFTGTGHTDILVICGFQSVVWVLPGLGTGQFGMPLSTNTGLLDPEGDFEVVFNAVAVADFDRDGYLDLAMITAPVGSQGTAFSLSILRGNGHGTFQQPRQIPLGTGLAPAAVLVTADFNGDGIPDLAAAITSQTSNSTLSIYLGKGDGTFQVAASYNPLGSLEFGNMFAADVNRDGKPDLLVAASAGSSGSSLTAYLGKGDGTFTLGPAETDAGVVGAIVAADFRGTGTPDLVEELYQLAPGNFPIDSVTTVLRAGNGDGSFQPPMRLSLPSGYASWWFSAAVGDWNGDGLPGLAFTASPLSASLVATGIGNPDGTINLGQIPSAYAAMPVGELVVMPNTTLPSAPAIEISSSLLSFSGVSGGPNPPSQYITLSYTGAGVLSWTAKSSVSWLIVSPAAGSGAATLTISVASVGLTTGVYSGTIQITSTGAFNSPQNVSVLFTITPPVPIIASVVNGASFQPGFESGSWVTIRGTSLSNTNPGRTWQASEIINGQLPTALDGTSVTVDGKPSYVYYVSPTQLNIQAPADANTGPVNVVVANNGQVSAAFVAQLQTYSPAFFQYGGTSYAIASHYPDYALVGNPNVVAGTIAAHPGDVLILWTTGFGPTNPLTPAGIEVVAASSVASQPEITAGGVPVTMLSAVISPGSAGLYQVAIQLPADVPTGAIALQASVSGVQSPAGSLIFVAGR